MKLIKVCKEFGIGFSTVVDFLHSERVERNSKPTAIVTPEMHDKLCYEFQSSKAVADRVRKKENEPTDKSSVLSAEERKATLELPKDDNLDNTYETSSEIKNPLVPDDTVSKLAKLGQRIKNQREHEVKNRVRAPALACIKANYLRGVEYFWIVNPSERQLQVGYDITGHVNAGYRQNTQYNILVGRGVMKSTKVAEYLTKKPGVYTFMLKNKEVRLEVFHHTIYTPNPYNDEAIDLKTVGIGHQTFTYRTLKEWLDSTAKLKEKIKDEKAQLESKRSSISEEEIARIENRLKQEENALLEAAATAKSFIRAQTKLRYQPVLDEIQANIKNSFVFTGDTLIINGGPGTGKTTSLIQRINFLIDPHGLDDYAPDLSNKQKEAIIASEKWVFYSPGALLKDFLKDNMIREGLIADDKHVMVWSKHQMTLFRDYQLTSPNGSPFSFYKDEKQLLLPAEPVLLKGVMDAFENFFLERISGAIYSVTENKVYDFSWKNLALQIKGNLAVREKPTTVIELIRLIIALEQQYSPVVTDLSKRLSEAMANSIARCVAAVNYHAEIKELLEKLLRSWEDTELAPVDEDIDTDEEIEEELDVIQTAEFNFERSLSRFARPLLRKLSSSLASGNKIKLSEREEKLKELLDPIIDLQELPQFKQIGELALFTRSFGSITKGLESMLLSAIPASYKQFRKQILGKKNNLQGINYPLLEILVTEGSPRNRKIHINEIAFLINFINEILHRIHQTNFSVFEGITHKYKSAFITNSKHVIGVDEATDFHPIELKCMHSLRDTEVSSVTLSGDLMQRMRRDGVKDWTALQELWPNIKVENLLVSYRQSPTLLQLAKELYAHSTGQEPLYDAYMQKSVLEPKPLYFMSQKNEDKLNWIADRVMDIFDAYGGMLPSVAVFVPSEEEVNSTAIFLGENERIVGMGIEVMACTDGKVLGDQSAVRVFSVAHIKGLEFESVFFHNVDHVASVDGSDSEAIFKHLYVGLSRATFYLGLTMSSFPKTLDTLKMHFQTGKWK